MRPPGATSATSACSATTGIHRSLPGTTIRAPSRSTRCLCPRESIASDVTDPAELRSAIVNPARLPAARAMEVCMQCHLETTSFPLPNEIRRYDRAPYSYRPGEPLTAFMLFYDHAPGRGKDDKFEIVSSAYRLRKS